MKEIISVIIVNYNGLKYLDSCFNSLLKTSKDNFSLEIIMVDNLSKDNSVNFVKKNFPDIEGHERIGYLLQDIEELLISGGFTILEKGYTYSSFETLANDISYFITGGREKHRFFYSVAFPVLLCLAFLGKHRTPRYGSGVYIIGERKS